MSDLHGNWDDFSGMLEEISFDKNDKLYILGDLIDRGDNPIEIIDYVMENRNVFLILGNHEDMMLKYYENREQKDHERWMRNGGGVTQAAFESLNQLKRNDIIGFFNSAPLFLELEDYCLVHAGIKITESEEFNPFKQTRRDLVWIRNEFFENPTGLEKKVIFGHTPTVMLRYTDIEKRPDEKMSIWYDDKNGDKIGIDCGVAYPEYGGRLGCLRLNDMVEFYI